MQQLSTYIGYPNDPQTMQGKSVFTCPSSSLLTTAYPVDQYYSYFSGAHAAYAVNGKFSAVNSRLIIMPAEQILGGDVTDGFGTSAADADKDDYTQSPIDKQSTFHNGMINLLYVDGHVAEAKWNANALSQGYFDPTRMSSHYSGTKNPTTGNYYNYQDSGQ